MIASCSCFEDLIKVGKKAGYEIIANVVSAEAQTYGRPLRIDTKRFFAALLLAHVLANIKSPPKSSLGAIDFSDIL